MPQNKRQAAIGSKKPAPQKAQSIAENKSQNFAQAQPESWANLILDGIEEPLFSLDREWRFTFVNRLGAKLLGREKEFLIGKNVWEEFPTLDTSNFGKFYRRIMQEGKAAQLEDFSYTTEAWYDVRAYPVREGLVVYFQDITERKGLEHSIQESEKRFRILSEASFEGVIIHHDRVIIEANERVAELLGYSHGHELIGRNIDEHLTPESLSELQRRISQGSEEAYEGTAITREGVHFPVEARGKRAKYKGQDVRVKVLRDITERKQLEQQIRESEERYKALSEATFEAIVLHKDNIVINVNQTTADMFGYASLEECVGLSIFLFIAPESITEVQQRIAEDSIESYEALVQKKDGSIFPVEVRSRYIEYQGQSMRVSAFKNISERKQAQEMLGHIQAQLLQSQKMEGIGRLAGGIAHDFNNILTAIMGYSQLVLLNLDEDNPIYSDVAEIQSAANRASALTHQLLAFSRQQVLQPQIINLNNTVDKMGKLLHRVIGEDIELNTSLNPLLGEILTDPGQIEQVILNLAVNARDAMPNGGKLIIETANVELDKEYYLADHPDIKTGAYVMMAVSDTGIGMDAATQEKIFEPFFTTKEPGKGTGLGLATVYGIINQSGGYIWVYSEVGVGTTFKIYLPRIMPNQAENPANSEADLEDKAQTKNEQQASIGQGRTILVVEDEPLVRALIQRVLTQANYKVLEAHNGQEGLALLNQHQTEINLIITDVIMPQMSGSEFVNRLKASNLPIKVLCISGYTDRAIQQHNLLQQCDAFLQKPFTPQVLLNQISEILKN